MEKEKDNQLAFLDVLITRTNYGFRTPVYRKSPFPERYLNFNFHHPYSIKRGIAQCLKYRAKDISSDRDTHHKEMIKLSNNLLRNNYPNYEESSPILKKRDDETNKLSTVCLLYVKDHSEKVQMIFGPYDIRTVFKSNTTRHTYLLRVKRPIAENMTKYCVYSISCSCGRLYKSQTCCPLKIRVEEHRKAVTRRDIDKSVIADHVWKNGDHLPLWDEVKILENTTGKHEN
ncbi:uncharacterized protein LOC118763458 [Octopus sinensis]|uniref:Uncharacterized protein LOC118763458 n=1 Tax=Octopus sinensis TaxID=2607531 RepID=A0A7E6EUH4_9MOLL|nr:uncharacterized protein LOC118763458 [Octopus sinensis]